MKNIFKNKQKISSKILNIFQKHLKKLQFQRLNEYLFVISANDPFLFLFIIWKNIKQQ